MTARARRKTCRYPSAPLANDSDLDGDSLIIPTPRTTNGTVVIVGGTNLVFTDDQTTTARQRSLHHQRRQRQ